MAGNGHGRAPSMLSGADEKPPKQIFQTVCLSAYMPVGVSPLHPVPSRRCTAQEPYAGLRGLRRVVMRCWSHGAGRGRARLRQPSESQSPSGIPSPFFLLDGCATRVVVSTPKGNDHPSPAWQPAEALGGSGLLRQHRPGLRGFGESARPYLWGRIQTPSMSATWQPSWPSGSVLVSATAHSAAAAQRVM